MFYGSSLAAFIIFLRRFRIHNRGEFETFFFYSRSEKAKVCCCRFTVDNADLYIYNTAKKVSLSLARKNEKKKRPDVAAYLEPVRPLINQPWTRGCAQKKIYSRFRRGRGWTFLCTSLLGSSSLGNFNCGTGILPVCAFYIFWIYFLFISSLNEILTWLNSQLYISAYILQTLVCAYISTQSSRLIKKNTNVLYIKTVAKKK